MTDAIKGWNDRTKSIHASCVLKVKHASTTATAFDSDVDIPSFTFEKRWLRLYLWFPFGCAGPDVIHR